MMEFTIIKEIVSYTINEPHLKGSSQRTNIPILTGIKMDAKETLKLY